MFRILDILKKSKTLTFKAQFELSLFLKGLGLDYYDQCDFWKDFVCHLNMTSVYGMDDHGKDYSPHCCVTMIMRECPKSIYQMQGCPFRYMARAEMKMYLRKMDRGLRKDDIDAIAGKVPDHPQVACRLFFDAMFPNEQLVNAGLSHPVEFFIESERRIKKARLEH
jgi:hypothetical protein